MIIHSSRNSCTLCHDTMLCVGPEGGWGICEIITLYRSRISWACSELSTGCTALVPDGPPPPNCGGFWSALAWLSAPAGDPPRSVSGAWAVVGHDAWLSTLSPSLPGPMLWIHRSHGADSPVQARTTAEINHRQRSRKRWGPQDGAVSQVHPTVPPCRLNGDKIHMLGPTSLLPPLDPSRQRGADVAQWWEGRRRGTI
ncbi:hypothetical protein VTK73DRAFT_10386 [Phialemonium thermophilum]|uniref:Uncharacterized protein n=1 Tax=Phialemonium thermophilum TaxID=223376 RepID=A0ABR3VX48_9PEZI